MANRVKVFGKIVFQNKEATAATNIGHQVFDGVMGVPITFLDKYNPEQFEIVGTTESNDRDNDYRTRFYTSQECRDAYLERFGKPGVYDLNASGVVNGIKVFKRVLIRRK